MSDDLDGILQEAAKRYSVVCDYDDLAALAIVYAANGIEDPRLRCRACGASETAHECPWAR